jgi:hypothetical protein
MHSNGRDHVVWPLADTIAEVVETIRTTSLPAGNRLTSPPATRRNSTQPRPPARTATRPATS